MGRLTQLMLTMSIGMIIFYVLGILPTDSITGGFFTLITNPTSLLESTSPTSIIGIFLIAMAAIAVVGTTAFANDRSDFAVFAGFMFIIVAWVIDFFKIYGVLASYNPFIAMITLSPFMLYTLFTILEWWRGTDVS